MDDIFSRTRMALGDDALAKLSKSKVAVFGVGGVGGYIAEALARSGVGFIDLIDKDVVSLSNINRQIIALHSTIGKPKTEVMKERILDINPNAKVNAITAFYTPDTKDDFTLTKYDFIADAIDTVSAKIDLIVNATELNIPIISACGAGNKLDATAFKVSDIYKTKYCPLAKVMRYELKKRGVKKLKVVYSEEEAIKTATFENGKPVPSSVAFVPSVMGLIMAGEIIKELIKTSDKD